MSKRKAPAEVDIATDIVAMLPKELAAKLYEAQNVLGKAVEFFEKDDMGGPSGGMDPSGKIYLLTSVKRDNAVVGEEIMHLHWRTSGRPWMKPLTKDRVYGLAIRQIGGHFEEYSFFPFLESLKLNPRAFVDANMATTERLLKHEIYYVTNDGDTDSLRALLAALFVQAKLMTNNREGAAVLKVFEDEVLVPYAKIGQLVCDEIVAAQKLDDAGVRDHMERTVFTHLRLPKDAVEVTKGS